MEKIREYLLNNEDTLTDVVSELNCYNGCLEYLDFFENDKEFFKAYFNNPMEAIRAICYGDYNYNDDYIRFNGYGNIDSYTKAERDDEIKSCIDEIVDRLIEYYECIEIYDEELLSLLEEDEEAEEE